MIRFNDVNKFNPIQRTLIIWPNWLDEWWKKQWFPWPQPQPQPIPIPLPPSQPQPSPIPLPAPQH